MIEIINTNAQTVDVNQNVLFNETVMKCGCGEYHRAGSGVVRLIKGGRYLVTFSGNVAVPTGETAGAVELTISSDGDDITGTSMVSTPTVVDSFNNVSAQTYLKVVTCCGNTCCVNVSIRNTGTIPVTITDPNLTVVRVA